MGAIVVKVATPLEGKKQKHSVGWHYYWSEDGKNWVKSNENVRALRSPRKIRRIERWLKNKYPHAKWMSAKHPKGHLPESISGPAARILVEAIPTRRRARLALALPEEAAVVPGEFIEQRKGSSCMDLIRPTGEALLSMQFKSNVKVELLPEEWETVLEHFDDVRSYLDAYQEYIKLAAKKRELVKEELQKRLQATEQ